MRTAVHQKEAGFTLVELMTVLVITGLMTSAVVILLPKSPPATRLGAEQLSRALAGLSQSAVIEGQSRALGLSETQYALMAYEGGQWRSEKVQDWPAQTMPALIREGEAIALTEDIIPLIIFEAAGLSTPFSLTLISPQARFVLHSQGDGKTFLEAQP